MYKHIIGGLIILGFAVQFVVASERNLPGIDLITREERGADESRRYASQSRFKSIQAYRDAQEKELEILVETDLDKYFDIKRQQYETELANEYLHDHFGEEQEIHEVIEYHLGNELRRPVSIKQDKMKFLVHHTAKDFTLITGGDDKYIEEIRNIYKFHAFQRGRGDIGYNFLIDPDGNIYEGRAGGEGTVGAHASRNNSPTLGISLMGNFDIQKPTAEQMKALIDLLSVLADKYDVDPLARTMYHRRIDFPPYLESNENFTIAGHRDAGYTACPGYYLYELLPDIRDQIRSNLIKSRLVANRKTSSFMSVPGIQYSNGDAQTVTVSTYINDLETCRAVDSTIRVLSCSYNNGKLTMRIRKNGSKATGIKKVKVTHGNGTTQISMIMLWQDDIDPFTARVKSDFEKSHGITQATQSSEKIAAKISVQEAKQLMLQKARVLLYQLSTDYDQRNIRCDTLCQFVIGGDVVAAKQGTVKRINKQIHITVNQQTYIPEILHVTSDDGIIHVDNYDRKSYAGIPRNSFKGMLTFQQGQYKDLSDGKWKNDIILINTLNFTDYIKGVVETHDGEHYEKNKVMSLLVKNYMLFYMHPDNRHPSIPLGGAYNATDDPRSFQKYVGAGLEKTVRNWYRSLEDTKNEILTYNGYVAILPYFNCSAGFTYAAAEKRGRTDTPYLTNRLDLAQCDEFNGHGVGLSGKGAQRRAEQGFDYEKIIEYYFPDVEITSL